MTKVYLIRHAEAEGNLYRVAQGQHESCLTDRGWRQVRALEARFRAIPVDAVYTSSLYRARATAMAVARPKGLTPRLVPDLREIYVGDWEGRTWGEIARMYPEEMRQFSREIDRGQVPGAEAPAAMLDRIAAALRKAAAENEGRTIAAVSHGYAIRLFLASVQGLTLAETGATSHGDNTAVSLLEWEDGVFRLLWRDDNSHLQTPEFLRHEKPVTRQNALEPGLWFQPLDLSREDHAALWREAVEAYRRPGTPEAVEAAERPETPEAVGTVERPGTLETVGTPDALPPEGGLCLAGYVDETPVSVLRMGAAPGDIGTLYVRPAYRKRGFGCQLLGQAVRDTRQRGGETLSLYAAPDCPFPADNGFTLTDAPPRAGRALWRKSTAFPPLD